MYAGVISLLLPWSAGSKSGPYSGFAAMESFEGHQGLTRLTPKRALVAAEAVERVAW